MYINRQNRLTGGPTQVDHILAYVHYERVADYWIEQAFSEFEPGAHPNTRHVCFRRAQFYERLAQGHYRMIALENLDAAKGCYRHNWRNDTYPPLPAVFDPHPLGLIPELSGGEA